MKILYYDCFAGISGDMNLAAMVDLGVDAAYLAAELGKLGLEQEFELKISEAIRQGIRGTRADVLLFNRETLHAKEHAHGHEHHDHAHHDHGHEHEHEHGHGAHRNLADIEAIIRHSALPQQVQETSLRIFTKLAAAEARVHGKGINEVHFHEVGATDSIVDIVGAAICFHCLGVDAVWAAPVELGGGFVHCAHGTMPVPAPATAEILQGVPTTRGTVAHEATTPTGAAILATLADRFTCSPAMVAHKTGYGIGHRETDPPNVLRVHLAQTEEETAPHGVVQQACLLQCNIDDMTAEMLGAAMDLFMEEGAMDVHFTPVLMKKNRPATSLSLLCGNGEVERFKELIFRHTSTLGVKSISIGKTVLETTFGTVETPLGPVKVKNAYFQGKMIRSKPEFEECRTLARNNGISLAEVYALIEQQKKDNSGQASDGSMPGTIN